MLEIIVFAAALALDQLVKYWAVTVLAAMPGGAMPILGEWFYFFYAENTGEDVSFLRGRSVVMDFSACFSWRSSSIFLLPSAGSCAL